MWRRCWSIVGVRGTLVILFYLTIIQLVAIPLLEHYWLDPNDGPPLTPEFDYRTKWISDSDFRRFDAMTGSADTVPGGRKSYAAGETWQRFRPYYVTTPDGNWHLMVLAREPMKNYGLRAYFKAVGGAVFFSIIGFLICLFVWNADSSSKAKEPDRSSVDLE